MLQLPTAVYFADHGYAWQVKPAGIPDAAVETLYAMITEARGAFADPEAIDRGIVVRGGFAAAYMVRTLSAWDSEGRSSEYAALAFFEPAAAAAIDFGWLFGDEFFRSATRTPAAEVRYDGPVAAAEPLDAAGRLLCRQSYDGLDPAAAGALLAKYLSRAEWWHFAVTGEHSMSVKCARWQLISNKK